MVVAEVDKQAVRHVVIAESRVVRWVILVSSEDSRLVCLFVCF